MRVARREQKTPLDTKGVFDFDRCSLVAVAVAAKVAAWAILAWASFAYVDGAAIQFFAIELFDSLLGLSVAAHFDKAEAFAAVCVAVDNDLGGDNSAGARKKLCEVVIGCAERQ